MHLKTVLVRFYRSFNFDYLRKHDAKLDRERVWERLDDGRFYPYVRVPIDPRITAVVGANESGKSHLLSAIENGLSGKNLARDDFCRHSQFFAVEAGKMRWPDFGFEWAGLTSEERAAVSTAVDLKLDDDVDCFLLLRNNRDALSVCLPADDFDAPHPVARDKADALIAALPTVFRLKVNVKLPASVPIPFLAGDAATATGAMALSRRQRSEFFSGAISGWFESKGSVEKHADDIVKAIGPSDKRSSAPNQAELNLARDLVRKVARIDPEALTGLHAALGQGNDAYANSVVEKINEDLAARLNFPRWWVQDRDFRMLVSAREQDLVFTIRDRTGKEYAFGERSSGLQYFLSYYIQFLSHRRRTDGREILLMDEPDAYLSNQGQQDLLKIFDAFACPTDPAAPPIQVIYVTHSPFLVDKNHGERIRVLEKGVGEEGTRVVRDASRNHYEPLRSAFGSFVGETTFIGHCNLVVEGQADQILFAGAAAHLRASGASELETLDLNRLTIVPASGASHVPYIVYLARGRDVEKPAIVVLLDSDEAGNDARKGLARGGPKRRQLLGSDCILQLSDLTGGVPAFGRQAFRESEDLVPAAIAVEAIRFHLREVCGASDDAIERVSIESIAPQIAEGESIFAAFERCVSVIDDYFRIDKNAFARAVVETLAAFTRRPDDAEAQRALADFATNMKLLFGRIRAMQRKAERDLAEVRVSARVDREKTAFLRDHPQGASREQGYLLMEAIDNALDDSAEADAIRAALQGIRRDFGIERGSTEAIANFSAFADRLDRLRYAERQATQASTLQELAAAPTPLRQ